LAHTVLVRRPSVSAILFTAPLISSSKAGQPQCESNFESDLYNGELQRLQIEIPFSSNLSYLPISGYSVPLRTITSSSYFINLVYSILLVVLDGVAFLVSVRK
jgi:hypothetical protein